MTTAKFPFDRGRAARRGVEPQAPAPTNDHERHIDRPRNLSVLGSRPYCHVARAGSFARLRHRQP